MTDPLKALLKALLNALKHRLPRRQALKGLPDAGLRRLAVLATLAAHRLRARGRDRTRLSNDVLECLLDPIRASTLDASALLSLEARMKGYLTDLEALKRDVIRLRARKILSSRDALRRLRKLAARIAGAGSSLDDLVQEAAKHFLEAIDAGHFSPLRALGDYEDFTNQLAAYFVRIVQNLVRSEWRRPSPAQLPEDLATSSPSLSDQVAASELVHAWIAAGRTAKERRCRGRLVKNLSTFGPKPVHRLIVGTGLSTHQAFARLRDLRARITRHLGF